MEDYNIACIINIIIVIIMIIIMYSGQLIQSTYLFYVHPSLWLLGGGVGRALASHSVVGGSSPT